MVIEINILLFYHTQWLIIAVLWRFFSVVVSGFDTSYCALSTFRSSALVALLPVTLLSLHVVESHVLL